MGVHGGFDHYGGAMVGGTGRNTIVIATIPGRKRRSFAGFHFRRLQFPTRCDLSKRPYCLEVDVDALGQRPK
jgi:hypothetical protein